MQTTFPGSVVFRWVFSACESSCITSALAATTGSIEVLQKSLVNVNIMYPSEGQSDSRQNRLARGCRADCSYKFNEHSDSREIVAPAQQFSLHREADWDRRAKWVAQAVESWHDDL